MEHPMYEIIDNALSAGDGYSVHVVIIWLAVQLLYSLTGLFLSWMLTRIAKLVRCVVVQVTDVLLEWLLSKVTPSVAQPPT